MMTNDPVRTFDTPDVDSVSSVSIHHNDTEDGHPFYATQYNIRDTFGDGTEWHAERDTYVLTDDYRRAVAASTHIPIEDIRLESHPVAEPTGYI